MDDVRSGRLLRALRRRLRLRQADLAIKAGVSQSLISLVERGHLDRLSLRTLRAIFGAVDARYEGGVTWRGGAIDRLLDEGHAAVQGAFAGLLGDLGWDVLIEVTFNDFGDRGSIDILAARRDLDVVLVVEIKTELAGIDATVRRLDVKQRLVAKITMARLGWRPTTTGRLLVIRETATNRRRVGRHEPVLRAAFPHRAAEVRSWLRRPVGPLSGLLFSSRTNPRGPGRGRAT